MLLRCHLPPTSTWCFPAGWLDISYYLNSPGLPITDQVWPKCEHNKHWCTICKSTAVSIGNGYDLLSRSQLPCSRNCAKHFACIILQKLHNPLWSLLYIYGIQSFGKLKPQITKWQNQDLNTHISNSQKPTVNHKVRWESGMPKQPSLPDGAETQSTQTNVAFTPIPYSLVVSFQTFTRLRMPPVKLTKENTSNSKNLK